MSDKEPRRRKKRKDSQSQRKDDIRSDDQFFMPTKSDTKDSDQEAEEEVVVPSHQPSAFAKFVFVILFSGLVVSMSFIFISLQGADRGEVDIFDDHHAEEIEILHDDHDGPTDHDEPTGLDDHDEHAGHDDHDEETSESLLQENIADFFPGIGSFLSFGSENTKEPETDSISDSSEEPVEPTPELPDTDTTVDDLNTIVENSIEENLEDTDQDIEDVIYSSIHTETTQESIESISSTENSEFPTSNEPVLEHHDVVQDSDDELEELDFTSFSPEVESVTENYLTTEEILESAFGSEEEESSDQVVTNVNDFVEATTEGIDEEFSYYEKEPITNQEDFKIRDQLDDLEDILQKSPEKALKKCEDMLKLYKGSPRLHYIKAQAMDKLAESQRSNKFLEDAIAEYQKVMSLKDVPDELYLTAGKKAADRMRFRGFLGKSVKLLHEMTEKFPQNVAVKNLLAVAYLMIGQNKEAKRVLTEVLKVKSDSGFAKVHLGFILKTDDSKHEEAAKLLKEGIATREEGVIDGRFYFHLGDALHRIGKQNEAMKVYEEAVKEGLFLSVYQRSLYNVNGLTGKPWWDPLRTVYAPDFKILEKNWMLIRDEALSLTNEKNSGFLPETEGLQDTGDWKQFELFARGRKIEKNCVRAPKTCSIISQIPNAVKCKRGQVKFSIMQPSTHVWAHTGPTNCRLRSHLGLVIPEGTSIRVANETRTWKEGKVILFDDSFEHEVWHNGSKPRMVLIVDFWHPELTDYQKRHLTPI
ncbi:hypothetical protein TNIN_440062 [Trichonephila inaurata madagascariensis]|uniref:Aspartyl/asparaginy/proline hydroxylase domain-containing protein n=1 Tax=Trichonephila inaurata madagascariensis TaxID=2747483 RepID=A0A8X6X291_9ARAC|nr:hypothetical protein TNIN_440062 [Trichonephila inaurata madagascariensis]